MASRIKPQENRPTFKKRTLRPWKPVIELDNSSIPDARNASSHSGLYQDSRSSEFSLPLLQKPLEDDLALKTQDQEEIRSKLSNLDNARITVGGFFKPKNVLFLDEKESSEQTFYLLNTLRDRKFEIAEINHQLKLAETLEQIQRSTQELSSEHRARTAAEEKALTAQKAYKYTLEQKQALETKLSIAEQIKNALEQKTVQLETRYQETSQKYEAQKQYYESQLQTLSLETESLQNRQQSELELRKQREAELDALKIEQEALLNARLAAEEKVISTQQELQQVLEHSQSLANRLLTAEQTKVSLEHKVSSLEISLQDKIQQYESELQAQSLEIEQWQTRQGAELNLRQQKEEALAVLQVQYQTLLEAQAIAETNALSVQSEFKQSQEKSQTLAARLKSVEELKSELEIKAATLEKALQEVIQKYELEVEELSLENEQWQSLEQTEREVRQQKEAALNSLQIEYQNSLEAQATAEANLLSTQSEFKQTQEQAAALAARLESVEHLKNELEYKTINLEQALQETIQKHESDLEALSLETEKLLSLQQSESELRKQSENEVAKLKQEGKTLEKNLMQTSEKWTTATEALQAETHHKRLLENENTKIEKELFQLLAENQSLTQKLSEERNAFEVRMASLQDHLKKISGALEAERKLRKHMESKTEEMAAYILNPE